MRKLLLIIAVAALAAVGASTARAGGVQFSIGLPLPPLPGVSIGGYPGYGCAYPGYGYGYSGYGYSCPAPVYGGVYNQPYCAPYYGYGYGGYGYSYGPRVYVAPRPWGGYGGWGRGGYYRHY